LRYCEQALTWIQTLNERTVSMYKYVFIITTRKQPLAVVEFVSSLQHMRALVSDLRTPIMLRVHNYDGYVRGHAVAVVCVNTSLVCVIEGI